MDDRDWFPDRRAAERRRISELSDDVRERAVEVLRESLSESTAAEVRRLIRADPSRWSVSLHFSWGLRFRNLLRSKGLSIPMLDDYYSGLVELAVFDGRWVEELDAASGNSEDRLT